MNYGEGAGWGAVRVYKELNCHRTLAIVQQVEINRLSHMSGHRLLKLLIKLSETIDLTTLLYSLRQQAQLLRNTKPTNVRLNYTCTIKLYRIQG